MRSARGRGQLPRQIHTEARSDHLLHPSNQLVQPSGQGASLAAVAAATQRARAANTSTRDMVWSVVLPLLRSSNAAR